MLYLQTCRGTEL